MRMRLAGTAVHCYARQASGVHSVAREHAAGLIRSAPRSLEVAADAEFVWIDIVNPTEAEASFLRDELGMHHLAVEDCLRGRQRPKLDRYPGYFFLVYYAARINPERGRMAVYEIHIFIGGTFLITVHDQEVPEVSHVAATWRSAPDRFHDSATVAHALLDAITDHYFPVIEHFADRLEHLEEHVFTRSADVSLQQAIHLRHEMVLLRRLLVPERDVLGSLVRRDLLVVRPELVPYFQDVYDHLLRLTEEIDSFREILTGLIEVQSSNTAHRLNETMQMLTAWSIILMSITVIAGIYGMNFEWMPELEVRGGYFAALAFMAAIGLALAAFFKRKGWL